MRFAVHPFFGALAREISPEDAPRNHPALDLVGSFVDLADDFGKPYLDALIAQANGRVRVVNILSHEPKDSGWQGAHGFVTDALDEKLGVEYRKTAAFICGSLPMVEAVEKKLLGLGVDAERIHADKFLPAR